jgi:hypothetical protein
MTLKVRSISCAAPSSDGFDLARARLAQADAARSEWLARECGIRPAGERDAGTCRACGGVAWRNGLCADCYGALSVNDRWGR